MSGLVYEAFLGMGAKMGGGGNGLSSCTALRRDRPALFTSLERVACYGHAHWRGRPRRHTKA